MTDGTRGTSIFALSLLPFILLATLNSAGYFRKSDLLKEAVPDLSRLGVLIQPSNFVAEHRTQVQETARALGLTLDEHAADTAAELPGALAALTASGVRAA